MDTWRGDLEFSERALSVSQLFKIQALFWTSSLHLVVACFFVSWCSMNISTLCSNLENFPCNNPLLFDSRVVSMLFMLFPPSESALRHCYADSKLQPVAEGDEEVPESKNPSQVWGFFKLGTTCWKWKELEFYIVSQCNAIGNPVKNSMK